MNLWPGVLFVLVGLVAMAAGVLAFVHRARVLRWIQSDQKAAFGDSIAKWNSQTKPSAIMFPAIAGTTVGLVFFVAGLLLIFGILRTTA